MIIIVYNLVYLIEKYIEMSHFWNSRCITEGKIQIF